jgi:polysaccharide chain length determinant protein (PEP-CTERM system associated)
MKTSPDVDLAKIVSILHRRKVLIAAVFVVAASLAGYLAVTLPNVYESSALILITPQKLPTSYVHSTVTLSVEQRIRTIIEQILSRSRLENIIREFGLYSASTSRTAMEDRIARLRKAIRTEVRRNDTLQLSFETENPDTAMQVTARLASLFIDENLKVREQQAMGTTVFINAEADRLRKELEEQEAKVNLYKAQHRFELPEQLDANLRTLQQLRAELQVNIARLSALRERKASLEQQAAEAETLGIVGLGKTQVGTEQPESRWQQIQSRKTQIEILLSKYSEKHPDVIRLKHEIQALEAEARSLESKAKESGPAVVDLPERSLRQTLAAQIAELNSEINSIQSANEQLRGHIATYQARTDGTPIRSIELTKITRTYEITLRKYQDLLAKSLDSQLSENMEKNQKGEQFQIVDPANFPQKPARPNRLQILLMGLLAGLGGGVGLVFLLENLDNSFRSGDELNDYVNLPLLATIPAMVTRGSVLEARRAQGIVVMASVGVLAVGLVLIRLFAPKFF